MTAAPCPSAGGGMAYHRREMRFALVMLEAVACLAAEKPVDFDRDVRPILSDRCFTCHGPDDRRRMANLRLDTEDGLKRVTSGDPAQSRLFARITSPNQAMRMPPRQTGPALTEPQIAAIRQWITEGA